MAVSVVRPGGLWSVEFRNVSRAVSGGWESAVPEAGGGTGRVHSPRRRTVFPVWRARGRTGRCARGRDGARLGGVYEMLGAARSRMDGERMAREAAAVAEALGSTVEGFEYSYGDDAA